MMRKTELGGGMPGVVKIDRQGTSTSGDSEKSETELEKSGKDSSLWIELAAAKAKIRELEEMNKDLKLDSGMKLLLGNHA